MTNEERQKELTALLVGATIIEVSFIYGDVDTLLIADKAGKVHKLESLGEFGEPSWIQVTKEVGEAKSSDSV